MRFLLLQLSAAVTVFAAAPVPRDVAPERIRGPKPRNVVFILSDDHRYDAMSFMGHPFARTPQMDAMARNGLHLKNARVTTSLCSPSRASTLTELYTFRHRVIDNNRPIPPGTVYFPQYLQSRPDYTLNVDGERVRQKGYITDELTDYAIDWLAKQDPVGEAVFPVFVA